MRGTLPAVGLAAMAICACSGSSSSDDDDGAADASGDDGGIDVPGDGDGRLDDGDGADAREYREYGGEVTDATRVVTSAWIQLLPGYSPGGIWVWLCRCEGPMPPPPDLRAEGGGCRLTHDEYGEPMDPTACRTLDSGTMDLTVGGTAYPLQHSDRYHPCWLSFGPDVPALVEGMEVRLSATGGADIPSFDETFTVPPQVSLTEPAPHGGESVWTVGVPWELRWDPPLDIRVRLSVPSSDHLWLQCEATTAPPFVVPAAVTAAWDELDAWGTVNFVAATAVVVPGDAPLTIEVGWGDTAGVTFAAPP